MITPDNFYSRLANENIFENEIFDLTDQTLVINHFKSDYVCFENCSFNCENLNFQKIPNESLILHFKNCSFNCNVSFSDSSFKQLAFRNTKFLKSLNLGHGQSDLRLMVFQFSNDVENPPELICDFSIRNTNIEIFLFEKIKHIEGKFRFSKNILGERKITTFENSTITNALFADNSFLAFSIFRRVKFNSTVENMKSIGAAFEFPCFYKNTFAKVSFSESEFINTFQFENCDFLSTVWFENCKNLNHSKLKFIACEFKGFSLFNKSEIHFLDITRCTFAKSSSFTDAEFNTLKLFEVKFGGGAYFDEMKINKVLDKSYLKDKSKILEWKRTLRAIKQELQKTENKIDFNTYRNYELAAHYKELNYKENFKDTSILWATKWSSNFGNWTWALCFTLIIGLVFFSSFYILENIHRTINLHNWPDFIYGYFRFFLITDFKNEYYESGESILKFNCFFSLIPFLIGKITVFFGLYEMIQSFRKFKA